MTATSGGAPPVLVRAATPAELPAVCRLVTEAGLPVDGLTNAALVLVAATGDTLVGTVALESRGAGPDVAFLLRSAAVAPEWRSRGVGEALISSALAHVDAARAPVALLTETAEHYFPRFGFAPVARERLPASLGDSAQLQGACPASARALLRPPASGGRP